ncbi:MAG: A24 family peptidase [Acidimicrobiia bacterium]|nr:A24 family peptidase [Acidimicrobiia bacterium]
MTGDDAKPEPADEDSGSEIPLVRATIIGMSVGAVVVVGRAHWPNPLVAIGLAAMTAVCGWLAVIDLDEHRLPNRIVGPLALAVTVAVVAGGLWTADPARSGRSLLFGLAAAAFLLIGNLIGGLGMGDVKYAFPLAATLGWFGSEPVLAWAFVTAVVGGLAGFAAIVSGQGRRYRIPYGPFMTIGFFAGILSAAPGP